MEKKIKFYDTSSLLLKVDSLFEEEEKFVISSITLEELENIKKSIILSENEYPKNRMEDFLWKSLY